MDAVAARRQRRVGHDRVAARGLDGVDDFLVAGGHNDGAGVRLDRPAPDMNDHGGVADHGQRLIGQAGSRPGGPE